MRLEDKVIVITGLVVDLAIPNDEGEQLFLELGDVEQFDFAGI